jgi:hypothetical protein
LPSPTALEEWFFIKGYSVGHAEAAIASAAVGSMRASFYKARHLLTPGDRGHLSWDYVAEPCWLAVEACARLSVLGTSPLPVVSNHYSAGQGLDSWPWHLQGRHLSHISLINITIVYPASRFIQGKKTNCPQHYDVLCSTNFNCCVVSSSPTSPRHTGERCRHAHASRTRCPASVSGSNTLILFEMVL